MIPKDDTLHPFEYGQCPTYVSKVRYFGNATILLGLYLSYPRNTADWLQTDSGAPFSSIY